MSILKIFCAFCALPFLVCSESLRLATYSGQSGKEPGPAATQLLQRVDPDLIFLQHVADRAACDQMRGALASHRIIVCSASDSPQANVAVISRAKPVMAWTQKSKGGGLFAVALLVSGPEKIAVISAQNSSDSDSLAEILAQAKAMEMYRTNRPSAFVVALDRLPSPEQILALRRADFRLLPAPSGNGAIFVQNVAMVSAPRVFGLPGSQLIACDTKPGGNADSTLPLILPGETAPTAPLPLAPVNSPPFRNPLIVLGTAALFLLVLRALFAGRLARRTTALVPVTAAPLSIGQTPLGVSFASWLKGAFISRVISQRQQLLEVNHAAAEQAQLIEQKLARLQHDLHERIVSYEGRIGRLEEELAVTTSENRELIRDQIVLLKKQLDVAKAETPFRRN